MAVPAEFVIVRHGQSERNAVERYDIQDDGMIELAASATARERPDWQQRLSLKGEQQAKQARKILEQKLGGAASFDALYVSPYVRTFETAAHIGGPDVDGWTPTEDLSERYWGHHNRLSEKERLDLFPATNLARLENPWYQNPEGGESMMSTGQRFESLWDNIKRDYAGKRVLAVSHHDTIYAAHRIVENLLPEEWDNMYRNNDVFIGNCMIVNWSSVNPDDPEDVRDTMHWKRYINPLDEHHTPYDGQWVELKTRQRYLGSALLQRVNNFKRLL